MRIDYPQRIGDVTKTVQWIAQETKDAFEVSVEVVRHADTYLHSDVISSLFWKMAPNLFLGALLPTPAFLAALAYQGYYISHTESTIGPIDMQALLLSSGIYFAAKSVRQLSQGACGCRVGKIAAAILSGVTSCGCFVFGLSQELRLKSS